MDAYSSGEELVVKTRKPYTITKQRERWTEVEHNRFLEALKLYGRAWQRIEEHIGTKTAVQIRSHAQKFFSKLEKEALVKGVPVAQAIDIEIPPPRPKRKPSNPYPRKTGIVGTTNAQVRDKDVKPATSKSPQTGKHVLDLEKEPLPEKPVGDERQQNTREDCDDEKNSESGAIFQETPSNEGSSFAIRSSVPNAANVSNSCNFMEFVPLVNNVANKEKPDDSHITSGPNEDHISSKPDVVDSALNNGTDTEMQGTRSFPRHVPVHVLDASLGASTQAMSSDVSYQDSRLHHIGIPGHPAFFPNPAMSATGESQNSTSRSTNHHMFPSFHPFAPFVNSQDDYNSFLQMSTTVSSLVVSTLLQNPAAHAAASFAASFWPSANTETSADSPAGTINGFPPRPMNPTPSMAAIAAATVAAATAWWAAHGLLPVCAPPNTEFACAPASATNVTLASPTGPALSVEKEREVNGVQKPDQEFSKSPETSSSDSGDSLGAKIDSGLTGTDNEKKTPVSDEQKDANQGKCKKQVDRSSCGSNTPSGSDIETDALEKNEKENEEEPKEPDVSNEPSEFSNRRNRYTSNANETWKEVSEEGRLAFQALFSREVLPQSFSPRNNTTNLDPENPNANDITRNPPECPNDDLSRLDLSTMTYEPSIEKSTQDESNVKDSPILTINMKTRKTGFKPYKRCSVEARETRVTNTSNQEQEKCAKRIRLQGEAST